MKIKCLLLLSCLLLFSCRERLINEEDFDRIIFSASGCLGNCPIMQVEIDSRKNYYFHGIMFTNKIGFYNGRMPDSIFRVFISMLEKVRSYELKQNETLLSIADAPVYEYKILSKNGAIVMCNILQEDEQLIKFLLNSYKQLYLSEVDSLTFLINKRI